MLLPAPGRPGLLPQFPRGPSTDPSPKPAEAHAGWDEVSSFPPRLHTPAPVTSSVFLPPFTSCRDFDSLSKDNVFENNRLVSPQTEGSLGGCECVLGGARGQGCCRVGAEARSCFALGPWLPLSPPPSSFWLLCAWNTSPPLPRSHPVAPELREAPRPGPFIPLLEAGPLLRATHPNPASSSSPCSDCFCTHSCTFPTPAPAPLAHPCLYPPTFPHPHSYPCLPPTPTPALTPGL